MKLLILVSLAIASPALAADQDLALSLVCVGSIDDTTTSNGFFGPRKQHQQIPDQVSIEVANSAGRARIPRKMWPMFARVQDGWAEIINLDVSADYISGAVNLASQAKPKLHIDRRSGSIEIVGALGRFFGTCKASAPGERAF